MNISRIILHIDINAFYASVEMALDPSLVGKPIIVAHQDPLYRGIILSPNYEARKKGIRTAMQVKEALLLCNNVITVEPKMAMYKEYSKKFQEYLLSLTPSVEVASIDEAYLDISSLYPKNDPIELAKKIQTELYNNLKLPTSIGIAPNKFLAKMASNFKKPLGITILRKRELDKLLWPLDISKMHGVGKKTTAKLQELGINTIGELANFKDFELLKASVGELTATNLYNKARGNDDSLVDPASYDKSQSVSNSHTFDNNIFDPSYVKKTLKVIANTVSYRLIKENKKAQTIGLVMKYSDYRQINRSKPYEVGTNDSKVIYGIVEDIFEEYFNQGDQVRLVGIFTTRLIDTTEEVRQISIFDDFDKEKKEVNIKKLLKNLQSEYGENNINIGYYDKKE